MKRYLIFIVLITVPSFFLNSCVENKNKGTKIKVEEKLSHENFDWLLGNWKRNNEKDGKETYEVWTKISHAEYYGIGFTIQNNDTLNQEKIRLVKSGEKWVLEVQLQNEAIPILFNMTSYNDQEFICENQTHDFPKLIKYWKNGSKINALVSGSDMEIPFEFERNIK